MRLPPPGFMEPIADRDVLYGPPFRFDSENYGIVTVDPAVPGGDRTAYFFFEEMGRCVLAVNPFNFGLVAISSGDADWADFGIRGFRASFACGCQLAATDGIGCEGTVPYHERNLSPCSSVHLAAVAAMIGNRQFPAENLRWVRRR